MTFSADSRNPGALDREPSPRREMLGRWALMLGILTLATIAMYAVRASLDKAHVTLVYLLIVLAASAVGGRALGLTVAALAFLCFDFFFLVPYLTLTISNPLDWLVLVAFLITSVIAAQLLYRANATADEAMQRSIEVDRLAALGEETLNAADADEALRAIADTIRHSTDADKCEIYLHGIDGRITRVARSARQEDGVSLEHPPAPSQGTDEAPRAAPRGSLIEWIIDHGASAVELTDGTVRVAHELPRPRRYPGGQRWEAQAETAAAVRVVTRLETASMVQRLSESFRAMDDALPAGTDRPAVRAIALPLQARNHTVGVLRLVSVGGLSLSTEQARLLVALAYYAALGAERARLVATAERAEAERRVEGLRSALLTAVSHDLRTPLTTIKGIANELLRGGDSGRAAIIESEADRLNALVSDLLDLSRIHAGAVRPSLAVNTVDDLLGAALQGAAGTLGDRPVQIDAPHAELLTGIFDFTQTLRVVVNLLDNAAKYSPRDSAIDIRASRYGDRLTIAVMDRGPGIPSPERDRIFEPFYRPPGVPPDVRGHGLGLSIARGLAEAEGASVRFAPREGGGSVFTLELPAAAAISVDADLPSIA
ncbi:MAG TPA: ATP-binding protein [Gemmatimonadaceae bacterium]|nr:ATP-binding protein [Gemmatimonadaceae bacterium]